MLITHSIPVYGEGEDILAYLDVIGVRRDRFVALGDAPQGGSDEPVELVLYDLSDASRFHSVHADLFPVKGTELDSRFTC